MYSTDEFCAMTGSKLAVSTTSGNATLMKARDGEKSGDASRKLTLVDLHVICIWEGAYWACPRRTQRLNNIFFGVSIVESACLHVRFKRCRGSRSCTSW
jgi:hypothetical protein